MKWLNRKALRRDEEAALAAKQVAELGYENALDVAEVVVQQEKRLKAINRRNHFGEALTRTFREKT